MFEKKVEQSLFSPQTEKTYIDKVLARQDVEAVRELVKKPKLNRAELLEMLYLLGSVESKLLNYSEWDRYVILKFFVWIREFAKMCEQLFDYVDDLTKKEATCKNCNMLSLNYLRSKGLSTDEFCHCDKFKPKLNMSTRTRQLIFNIERHIEHDTKFLVDLYLNISRTSLSLGATGLLELTRNKYELAYPNMELGSQDKTGFFNWFKRGS